MSGVGVLVPGGGALIALAVVGDAITGNPPAAP
jgi:hypothetical protein